MERDSRKIGLSFTEWLKRKKYDAILALLPLVCSFLYPIFSSFDISWITERRIEIINCLHLTFLILSFWFLIRHGYLKDVSEREKAYNIKKFIENHLNSKRILENGDSFLYTVVRFTVRHFYFSWIIVWFIWITQCFIEIIYSCNYDNIISNTAEHFCMHFHFFLRNLCYMISTTVIFYVYFLLSNIPVNVSEHEHEFKWKRKFIAFFLIVFVIYTVCDLFEIFMLEKLEYTCFILTITTLIGLFTCISIISVASRLNSPHLNVPVSIIVVLNIYAAVQVLYPLTIAFDILSLSGNGFGYSSLFTGIVGFLDAKAVTCTLELNDEQTIDNYYFVVFSLYNIISLFGQICLFFIVRWILDQRRLIFYILCRAKTIVEHNGLLEHFNQTYEE